MPRPFRFGVVAAAATSRADWVNQARRAEELGYATFLVPDHIMLPIAPLTALAVAASVTNSLRVGSMVFCNDLHHPALLAKEIATLDLLSDGRFELGLGAGYDQEDYTQTGIPFDPAGVRISRMEEALQIIRRLFTDEVVNFAGRHYTITDMRGLPRPVQKPHPPIFIGAGGKRMLEIAAREADSISISSRLILQKRAISDPTLQRVEWIRAAAGERFEQIELGCMLFHVEITDGKGAAARPGQQVGGEPDFARNVMADPNSLHGVGGSIEQIIDTLLARRERYGLSYLQVRAQQMEAFAPVVARLAGK